MLLAPPGSRRWSRTRISSRRPHEVTKPIIEAYQRYLHYYRKRDGAPLSYISQRGKITPAKSFFRWLARENHVLYNPASDIELPRMARRLPRHVLTAEEVDAVMRQADTGDPFGIRDRAMMEVLYSTGIRRMELAHLKLPDLDFERSTLMVREGKGRSIATCRSASARSTGAPTT